MTTHTGWKSALTAALGEVNKRTRTALIPLTDYLAPGQALPNDGVEDATALIQAGLNDMIAKADADPTTRYVLSLPAGRFKTTATLRVGEGRTTTVERVGVSGAGSENTIIMPTGTASGFVTNTPGPEVPACTGHLYSGFTMDFSNANQVYDGTRQLKAFASRGYVDCRFRDVVSRNSPATAFGVDFPVRVTFEDCHVIKTGQGHAGGVATPDIPVQYAKNISGFGIGTGLFEHESMTFINCTATDCQRAGFFFEAFDAAAGYDSRAAVINMVGCRSNGNRIGVSNVGGSGITAVNCEITDNTVAGWYGGVSARVTQFASINDTLLNCKVLRNKVGLYATGDSTTTQNYTTLRAVLGSYRIINSQFEDNTDDAILGERFTTIEGPLTIRGNTFRHNGGPAVHLREAHGTMRDLHIEGNYFEDNTPAALNLMVAMNAPKITENTFAGAGDAIRFHPAEPVTLPLVTNNTFRRTTNPMVNAARLDQTHITGNRIIDAAGDPDDPRLYSEQMFGGPSAGEPWPAAGSGWTKNTAGTSQDWKRLTVGIFSVASPSSSLIYRDLGTTGYYAEVGVTAASNPARSELIGVMHSLASSSSRTCIVAGVNGANMTIGIRNSYAVWAVVAGVSTLVWESSVPMLEHHRIALARKEGSTVTDIFIDGALAHTVDIPSVPATALAGVFSIGQVVGQDRFLSEFRAMTY